MIIKELNLGHFGKFQDKKITLTPGINVIYGKNEAGKSTLHAFIRGMLFGIEKSRGRASKEEMYVKYEPWNAPTDYHGSMIVEIDGTDYKIIRSFYKKQRSIQIVNLTTGRAYPADEHKLSELLNGLSEGVYKNTVSMGQLKSKTEQELARELKNYITNLATSKSTEVDVAGALKFLTEEKKEIEKSIPKGELEQLTMEIESDRARVEQIREQEEALRLLNTRIGKVKQELLKFDDPMTKEKKNKILELPVITEKYKIYSDLRQQIEGYKERLVLLKEKMKRSPGELDDGELIKRHLDELNELRNQKQVYEEEIRKKKLEWEEDSHKKKYNMKMIGVIMALFGIILCVIPLGNSIIRCFAGIGICAVGILQYIYTANKEGHIQGKHDEIEREYERKIFKLHSLRHDLLLVHRVTNETQLVMKHADLSKCQIERRDMEEREKEYTKTLDSLTEKTEALEQEILNFMKYFMTDPEPNDSCMQEVKMLITEFEEEIIKEEKDLRETLAELKSQSEKLNWSLESARNEEVKWEEDEKRRDELLKKKTATEQELQSIHLSIDTLQELSSCIHDTFGARLNEVVSKAVSVISEGEYEEVIVDEDLSIKVLKNHRYIPIEQLSAGTIDQIYLALRLAVGRVLFPHGNLPILLDDSFALYDDERMGKTLLLLAKQKVGQLIIFSCHKREMEFLKSNGIEANIIQL